MPQAIQQAAAAGAEAAKVHQPAEREVRAEGLVETQSLSAKRQTGESRQQTGLL